MQQMGIWGPLLITPSPILLCPRSPQSLLLKWNPPAHDGGAAIASYRVEMRCSPLHSNGDLEHSGVEPQQSLALTPHFLTIYRCRRHADAACGQYPAQGPCSSYQCPQVTLVCYRQHNPCMCLSCPIAPALTPAFSTSAFPHSSGAECCVQVTDLMPGTTYDFRVMAISNQGGSPWSAVGSATTLPSVPLAPVRPVVSACSSTSFQLNWREPYGQGASVTNYTVNMARMPAHRPTANGHTRALSVESDIGSGGGYLAASVGFLSIRKCSRCGPGR